MIPDAADPRWRKVLTTDSDIAAASLATRILIARLRREVAKTPSALNEKITELRDFFTKNAFATADIAGL